MKVDYLNFFLGIVARDKSFYASLYAQTPSQSQKIVHTEMVVLNDSSTTEWK